MARYKSIGIEETKYDGKRAYYVLVSSEGLLSNQYLTKKDNEIHSSNSALELTGGFKNYFFDTIQECEDKIDDHLIHTKGSTEYGGFKIHHLRRNNSQGRNYYVEAPKRDATYQYLTPTGIQGNCTTSWNTLRGVKTMIDNYNNPKEMDTFRVQTKSDSDHLTLMQILYSIGLQHHGAESNGGVSTATNAHQMYKKCDVTTVTSKRKQHQISGTYANYDGEFIQFGTPEFYQKMGELSKWWGEKRVNTITLWGTPVEVNSERVTYDGSGFSRQQVNTVVSIINDIDNHSNYLKTINEKVTNIYIEDGKVTSVRIGCKTVPVEVIQQVKEKQDQLRS